MTADPQGERPSLPSASSLVLELFPDGNRDGRCDYDEHDYFAYESEPNFTPDEDDEDDWDSDDKNDEDGEDGEGDEVDEDDSNSDEDDDTHFDEASSNDGSYTEDGMKKMEAEEKAHILPDVGMGEVKLSIYISKEIEADSWLDNIRIECFWRGHQIGHALGRYVHRPAIKVNFF